MARKKLYSILFTTVAIITLLVPLQTTAVAAEASTDPPRTIEVRHYFKDGEALPTIDKTIKDDAGNTYRLVSSTDPVLDESYSRPTQFYSYLITKDIPIDGIGRLDSYFSPDIFVEDGPFIGNINVASYDTTSVYEAFSGQVDRYLTIDGLPDNDVVRLPEYWDFEVSSSAAYGATQIKTLRLVSVEYVVTGANSLGLPTSYTAHLGYRGEESWLELHHYVVSAYYEGNIASSVGQYVVKSSYELVVEPVPVPAPNSVLTSTSIPAPILDPAPPLTDPVISINLALGLAAIVVVLALAWLLVWLLIFRKNAWLFRKANGNKEALLKRHINVTSNEATFEIPDDVNLHDQAQYSIVLRPLLANQQGELLVVWHDKIITKSELKTEIFIEMDNMIKEASKEAVDNMVIAPAVLTEGVSGK